MSKAHQRSCGNANEDRDIEQAFDALIKPMARDH